LIDVRLDADLDDLSEGEFELLVEAVGQNHQYEPKLVDKVEGGHDHIEVLVDRGILRRIEEDGSRYVMVHEDIVECAIVDDATPTNYSPSEEGVPNLARCSRNRTGRQRGVHGDDRRPVGILHPHYSPDRSKRCRRPINDATRTGVLGETDRDERRKLEFQFRQGRYPHFLSSGPAMELGVDIGDLNTLLLYGTPPNANSYLQRIGRAGRSRVIPYPFGQSAAYRLLLPWASEELIAADPQQVPLNEVNREVLPSVAFVGRTRLGYDDSMGTVAS